jgi:Adenine-specific methyltransferase EcoRI
MGNENTSLQRAKEAKEDEFYTQLEDIERELKHYKKHFAGKVVYCNCDDPRVSNFFHYFSYNFEKLRLKKLIATCYKNQDVDLFSQNVSEQAIYLEYGGDRDGNMTPDPSEIEVKALRGDGDFRSAESLELLKSADIVVTNPPFSLFREFIAQLMAHKKAFIILGNQNQVASNEMQQLLTDGEIWLGAYAGDMKFRVPDYYKPRETRYWEDNDGQKWRSLGTGCWFTNLDYAKRHEELILYKTYSPDAYPSYVNFDAIEVGTYKNIPADYPGYMGVPITALNKLSPEQFEIVGFSAGLARPMGEVIEGEKGSGRFYLDLGNGQYKRMYDRVVVRNRKL